MKKQAKPVLFYLSFVALIAGAILRVFFVNNEISSEAISHLSWALLGFGSSLSLLAVIHYVNRFIIKNSPELAKTMEIEEKDERNVRVSEKAALGAWYITVYTSIALMFTLVALGFTTAFWLALIAFVINVTSLFIYVFVYNKKMYSSHFR